ncbi:hypothetical protein BCR34DRAFT_648892 [Clohesyomyces aquaticus]|uniref:Death domain-containing protein n=1 Tax=Clohesyomyces aquaticus TaxID=1231657 RepID=A0A1Y1ZTC8_9PLEO|nr:hypothetical protein BCR34DRAFT_648892 [Clohesyomyces aquaticus]
MKLILPLLTAFTVSSALALVPLIRTQENASANNETHKLGSGYLGPYFGSDKSGLWPKGNEHNSAIIYCYDTEYDYKDLHVTVDAGLEKWFHKLGQAEGVKVETMVRYHKRDWGDKNDNGNDMTITADSEEAVARAKEKGYSAEDICTDIPKADAVNFVACQCAFKGDPMKDRSIYSKEYDIDSVMHYWSTQSAEVPENQGDISWHLLAKRKSKDSDEVDFIERENFAISDLDRTAIKLLYPWEGVTEVDPPPQDPPKRLSRRTRRRHTSQG